MRRIYYKNMAIPKGIIFEICKGLKIIKLACYHWQQIEIYICNVEYT